MNTDKNTCLEELNGITAKISGSAYEVSNVLGTGFLEKVYENALAHDISKSGLRVEQQKPVLVRYDGKVVGEYIADLLVEEQIIVELKAVKTLDQIHFAQCLNYFKATGLRLCLLINFGTSRIQLQRIAL